MFKALVVRVHAVARRRVAAHVERLSEKARGSLPDTIAIKAEKDSVALTGRGLKRRFVLDSTLRWFAAGER